MVRHLANAAFILCLLAGTASASALHGFTVIDVPPGDALNVRTGPGTGHPIQASYRNGAALSLTGACVGLRLDDLRNMTPAQKYAQTRTRWCQVWHDPAGDGNFVTGWAHARFLFPL